MHMPGGRIRRDDDAIQIGNDERVARGLEDATIARLHLVQQLFGAFVLGHIGMPASDAQRPPSGVTSGCGAHQHPAIVAIVVAHAMLDPQALLWRLGKGAQLRQHALTVVAVYPRDPRL